MLRKVEYRLRRREGEVEGEFIESQVDPCGHYPQGLFGSCGVAQYSRSGWDSKWCVTRTCAEPRHSRESGNPVG
jgi:hypothetical protein